MAGHGGPYSRPLGGRSLGRSRPGTRRNSAISHKAAGAPGRPIGGLVFPSPLRNSVSVVNLPGAGAGAEAAGGSNCASPRALDPGSGPESEALFDRFGSFEGLSAAVEEFYLRLCRDERIGGVIREVDPRDVRPLMMQLMGLSLQLGQHESGRKAQAQERLLWLQRCRSLLRQAGAQSEFGGPADAEGGTDAYDAVMGHMEATLELMGVAGPGLDSWGQDDMQPAGPEGPGQREPAWGRKPTV
ncbi:hypothetical protein HYH03_004813 [Edaphochlamys debaryana]|uniref:Uncharacterized protein n=1 Tax=Edaphochlamys debaryana TaxID=47281 RepID=A0A835YGL7_9CHLO|nr:hypothetical protein HYH03_004813 [Edaphochlamys debaryana]|eukprot:KAG2497224.1 hypothetical protein HYH03_004813 [Edaphochlamys debaryana]